MMTIYGQMDNGPVRWRTVHLIDAISAWRQWFGLVFAASKADPLVVIDGGRTFRVWSVAYHG